MTDTQLQRQGIAYRAWLNGRYDYYPHTLLTMGQQRRVKGCASERRSPFLTPQRLRQDTLRTATAA